MIELDSKKIQTKLHHRSIPLHIHKTINSTNDYLKQFIPNNKETIVAIAETQTAGRGRLERNWHSPFGENIYFSMLCPFEKDISALSGLSLVVGLAICRAIESVVSLDPNTLKVKWPNDVLANTHKISGTLIEIETESKGRCQVVIGIGMNVNMEQTSGKAITQSWSSLFKITGQQQDRNDLCAALIDSLIDYLEKFSQKGLNAFSAEWKKRDCLANTIISIQSGSQQLQGKCLGINEQGYLLLESSNKAIVAVSSGDATLLKSN